jgi:hypothetical protein
VKALLSNADAALVLPAAHLVDGTVALFFRRDIVKVGTRRREEQVAQRH